MNGNVLEPPLDQILSVGILQLLIIPRIFQNLPESFLYFIIIGVCKTILSKQKDLASSLKHVLRS